MLPAGAPAVVNIDDPWGQELASALPRVVTYGIQRPADWRAVSIQSTLDGLEFQIERGSGTPLPIRTPLVGRPNVYNILGVAAAASALGVPDSAIETGMLHLEGVPGRFQVVSAPTDDVRVVVDYAHTDDALKNLLETARPLTSGRLVTVFGCGGDRDKTKRPLMGTVAARLSDVVVLTSDNPRSEDPLRIIEEIKRGIVPPVDPGAPKRPSTPLLVNPDRRRAIEEAIRSAQPGDLVIVAGKGHEKYQVIGDRTIPFDDVEIAQAALQSRRRGSAV
jgi:UDP-N-acetylmuramoyl-L-alanyl-D-glutamate--2,6-diaminopimelate ligase